MGPIDACQPNVAESVGRLVGGQLNTDIQQLLIATMIQVLGAGSSHRDDLDDGIREIWPAIAVSKEDLDTCLQGAQEKGLVTSDGQTWRLDAQGQTEYESTRTRQRDLFERLAHRIRIHAYSHHGQDLPLNECQIVSKQVESDLFSMIGSSSSVFMGDVDTNGELHPKGITVPDLVLRGRSSDEEARERLVHSCVTRAINRDDPFGNELVSNIVKRCLIYSIITRYALREDVAVLGAADGTTVILDTRALLDVMSAPGRSSALISALHTARRLRMQILIPPLVLQEIQNLVTATRIPSQAELVQIRKALRDKEGTADFDLVHVRYAEAQEAGIYPNWNEFKKASEPNAIQTRLHGLEFDATIPSHVSQADIGDSFHRLFSHLSNIRSSRAENHDSMETDAVTLAVAWSLRRQRERSAAEGKTGRGSWPASIILSPDGAFTPAMSTRPGDPNGWPYTASIPAFIALMTQCQPAPDTSRFLRDIGKLNTDEAKAVAVATQVSSDRAKHLASRIYLGPSVVNVGDDRPDLSSIVCKEDYRSRTQTVEAALRHMYIQAKECEARQRRHRLDCIKELDRHVTHLRGKIWQLENRQAAPVDQHTPDEPPVVIRSHAEFPSDLTQDPLQAILMHTTLLTIHGLWSSPDTWNQLCNEWRADERLRCVAIKAFAYETPKSPWMGRPGSRIPSLDDIADNLIATYTGELSDTQHLAIVTHSQGGLVLQRFLARMLEEGRGRELARISSIVMLACPNNGSQYLGLLRKMLGFGRRPQLATLTVLNEEVARARTTVLKRVAYAQGVGENECRIPIHVYLGDSDGIVPRAVGGYDFPQVSTLRGDHFSILDPRSSGNNTAATVRDDLLGDVRP